MRATLYALAGILLALGWLAPIARGQAGTPRKRALLVAVNGYERGDKEKDAHNLDTTPDVEALADLLKNKLHFDEVTILKEPKQTTKKAILDAFRSFLINRTQPGDIVFFHYSGHGSQVEDAQDEVTGRDQTLVPSDYISVFDGSNDIRDKEIARLLEELHQKQPGNVTLSFDSCHSGTITRGRMLVRGFDRPIPARAVRPASSSDKAGGLLGPGEVARLGYVAIAACRSDQVDSEVEVEDQGHSSKHTDKYMGSLSYALCKAFTEANDKTTYRDVLERIRTIMQEKQLDQSPQLEGEIDQVLFGGGIIRLEPTILVELYDGKVPRLQAGFLMGMTEGSKLDIFPRGTKDPKSAQPIARDAEIIAVGPTFSVLKVDHLMPGKKMEDLRDARAVITSQVYQDNPLRVDLSAIPAGTRRDKIATALDELKTNKLVAIVQNGGQEGWDIRIVPPAEAFNGTMTATRRANEADVWDVRVTEKGSAGTEARNLVLRGSDPGAPDSVMLQRKDGSFLTVQLGDSDAYAQVLSEDVKLPERLQEALRRESRRRLLNALHEADANSPYKVEVRIIACDVDPDPLDPTGKNKVWKADREPRKPTAGGEIPMKVGDYFRVEVKNSGTAGAYVTILDLQPDGKIAPVWPLPSEKTNNYLPADPEHRDKWIALKDSNGKYTVFEVTEPAGLETFKAIATENEADFSPLLDPETLRSRGIPRGKARGAKEAETPLGQLLISAVQRDRAGARSLSLGGWATSSLHFLVLPGGSAATP